MAKIKLTAKQQEAVNYMAAGCVLETHRGTGGNSRDWATLRNSTTDAPKVASNTPGDLLDKGVVEVVRDKGVHWGSTRYKLTALGKSLAKPIEKQPTVTWWAVDRHGDGPESQEFVSETSAFLIDAKGRKTAKSSDWKTWFPTKELAVEYARRKLTETVEMCRDRLQEAEKELARFIHKHPK